MSTTQEQAQEAIDIDQEQVPIPDLESTETQTPEQAEEQESSSEGIDESVAKTKEGVPDGVQKRIDRAIRNAKLATEQKLEADRRLHSLEQQLQQLQRQQPQSAPVQQQYVDPNEPRKPVRQEFNDAGDYADALFAYTDDKRNYDYAKQQKASEEQQLNSYLKGLDNAHASRIEDAKVRYEDFDEVSDSLLIDPEVSRHPNFYTLAISVMESPNSADLQYYLADNIDEAKRLLSLPPLSAAREIGYLQSKLKLAPAKISKGTLAPTSVKTNPVGNNTQRKTLEEKRREAFLMQKGVRK